MIKISKRLVLLIIMILGFSLNVEAGNVAISASKSSVTVGSNVTVNLNITNLSGNFKVVSSDSSVLAGKAEGWCDNNVCENGMKTSIVFTAKKVGVATVSVIPIDVSDNKGEGAEFTSTRSIIIKVVEKNIPKEVDVNKTYNKNNYLKSLSIEGYTLSPKFNKDTLEYKVELNPGTEKVKVSATKEESSSTIKGVGEISISEGVNTINVVVTAENGNERTYKVLASVEEKDPIEITIDGNKYRVIKKIDLLPEKSGYHKSTVKINNFDIPCLYNEVTKVNLVGLKDSSGNIKFYSYDTKTGKYADYKEVNLDIMNLYIEEKNNSKYEKTNIKINDVSVPAYKLDGIDDYYLLYATNTLTGNKGYYLYDIKENSAQRYDTTLLENITKEKDKYLALVIVLSSVCFLSMLFLLIEVNKESKRKNED